VAADPIYLSTQTRGVFTLPSEVRKKLHSDEPGTQLRLIEIRDGVYELTAVTPVPVEDAWFWSDRWQQMEREAEADFAAGRAARFEDLDALLDDLND
jgi:antitoxin MazE